MNSRKYNKKPADNIRIANERIAILFSEAEKGSQADANRYVELARKIAMKYKVRLSKELKRRFCKYCYAYFKAGTATVRTKDKMLLIHCRHCDKVYRIPLAQKKSK